MFVKAAPGLLCPREENPREHITDAEAVEVEPTSYNLRLIADGSLVEVPAPVMKPKGGDQ